MVSIVWLLQVDFLATVDTPYIWELNIWYHTLNAGFQTRISGKPSPPSRFIPLSIIYARIECVGQSQSCTEDLHHYAVCWIVPPSLPLCVSGETDFPCIYGERVGLGRSYVKVNTNDGAQLTYDDWCQGACICHLETMHYWYSPTISLRA